MRITFQTLFARRLPGPGRAAPATLAALMLLGTLAPAVPGMAAAPAPGASAGAAGAGPSCSRVEIAPPVQVTAGKSTVIRPAGAIRRVLLGNAEGSRAVAPRPAAPASGAAAGTPAPADDSAQRPGVADIDVLLLGPTEVYVLGKSLGTTNLVLLEQSGRCTAVDVVVSMDTSGLQAMLTQLLPEEKNIRVSAAYDAVVLSGTVSDSITLSHVNEITNAYVRGPGIGGSLNGLSAVAGINPRIVNMLSVNAPQQVMLEVKVAEISKSVLDKFGTSIAASRTKGDWTYSFLTNFLSGGGAAAGAAKPINGSSVVLDAQKDDGLIKILAEPTVMAISGQKGHFLAGGKIFIPVAVDNGSSGRTITLEEKEFGVSVNFLPTVLSGGRINLEVSSEVSELNREGVGLTVPGSSGLAVLPSFTSRRARTTVQLADGQSFAIGGLIKNNSTNSIRALPGLGEIPILGALFRSTQFQTDQSELLFVITPRLVKPLPSGYALPTDQFVPPSRAELHLLGRLEGQRTAQDGEAAATQAAPSAAAAPGFQVK